MDNAQFVDGKLVLCLTKESAIGYVDIAPPTPLWARAEGDSVKIYFSEDVDQATAETISNYLITNVVISSARLLADKRTVFLKAAGVSTAGMNTMIVRGVRDCWSTPNEMPPKSVRLTVQNALTFPVSINAGGPAYQSFLPDQSWNETVEYGRLDGRTSSYPSAPIQGTFDPEIYRTELYDFCEYKIRVPNGRYSLVLMMAENLLSAVNSRIMTIVIEGMQVETTLDLVARAGVRTQYETTVTCEVTDGVLDIHYQALLFYPLLNGIRISKVGTNTNENLKTRINPNDYSLLPNYPNPFNAGTTIMFGAPGSERPELRVYDSLGRQVFVRTLDKTQLAQGSYYWDARDDNGNSLPSGIYFCRLEGDLRSPMQKMVYLK
jgi:hypothetical protein